MSAPYYARPPVALPQDSCADFLSKLLPSCGERTALMFGDRSLSYCELAAIVASFRQRLSKVGLAKGSRLAVAMPTSPEQIALMLAAFHLGVIVVPFYDSAPAAEIRAKCVAAAVDALAVDATAAEGHKDTLAGLAGAPFLLKIADVEPVGDPRGGEMSATVRPDDLAFMPFSSGSTGEPKLILLSHRNVLASRLLFAEATHLASSSVLVHFLPLAHVYGWMALTAALGRGAKVVLHQRYDFDHIAADIARHKATAIFAVSQVILDLSRADDKAARQISSLKWINTGAAPLAPAIIEEVATRYGLPITTGYGLTEAAPVAHCGRAAGPNRCRDGWFRGPQHMLTSRRSRRS